MMKSNKIVYVLGTKAQFIKCKFILKYLNESGQDLIILDTGQHKEITQRELLELNFDYEYIDISISKSNISTIYTMIKWFFILVFLVKKDDSLESATHCLVHGDTASTLIGLIYGKKHKLDIVHLESGYKSNNIFKPFPEEIIRNIVSKYSDILVVDGKEMLNNVSKYKNKKEIIEINRNTIYDSTIERKNLELNLLDQMIVTVHRTENIYNTKRLKLLVDLLIDTRKSQKFQSIIWYCHDITINSLMKHNLVDRLEKEGIRLENLVDHKKFISEITNSKVVLTDGGSIAEECSILDVNTIVWRDLVENEGYLKDNVILSGYSIEKINNFIDNLVQKQKKVEIGQSPSLEFVEKFTNLIKK